MVAVLQQIADTSSERRARLTNSDRSRFMTYVAERSELNHYQAYRMSRVFDQLNLGLLTQQLATFDRVTEYRDTTSVVDWDQALHEWIETENQARAETSARNGVNVVYLPSPTSRIGTGISSRR